jgi:hypothetical protein
MVGSDTFVTRTTSFSLFGGITFSGSHRYPSGSGAPIGQSLKTVGSTAMRDETQNKKTARADQRMKENRQRVILRKLSGLRHNLKLVTSKILSF